MEAISVHLDDVNLRSIVSHSTEIASQIELAQARLAAASIWAVGVAEVLDDHAKQVVEIFSKLTQVVKLQR